MTGYSEILNTQIDVDSPVTTGLMVQLRDNPIAITEGAVGAPRNQTDSIQDLAITEPKLADEAVTNIKIASEVPVAKAWIRVEGSTIIDSFNVASITTSTSSVTVNLVNSMANTDYAVISTGYSGSGIVNLNLNVISVSSFQVSSSTSGAGAAPYSNYSIAVFGDQ